MKIDRPGLAMGVALLLVLLSAGAMGQGKTAPPAKPQTPSEKELKAFQEAMTWFKKAEAMIGTPQENTEDQADLFRKALTIKPDFVEAHFNLGLIYMRQTKLKEAAVEFETIRKANPEFSANGESIQQLVAHVYRELGQNDEAIDALNDAVRKDPKNLRLLRALAYLQMHSTNDASAIPTLTAVVEAEPKDADALLNLGVLYQKQGRLDEAAKAYRSVIEVSPTDFNARYNLALLLVRQDKLAEATVQLEAANKIHPGNAEILERLGDAYSYQEQTEKAAQAYADAAGKEPDRALLLSKWAFTLAKLKRVPEAATVLEKSVVIDAGSPDAFYLLGDLYSELKRYDESAEAYNKSLKLNPKQKNVHYNLGTLLAETRHYGEARAELLAAIELDADYAVAWANLAIVCEKLELDKEAIAANEKVIALGKAGAAIFFRQGILYAKANNPDPAITNFSKSIQLEPDKYRQLLREELKNVHSVLDSVRYKDAFVRLLAEK